MMDLDGKIEVALSYIQNDTQYALDLFDGILKDQSDNICALNGKGLALMKLHKNDDALKVFNHSVSIKGNSSAYLNMGIISKNMGDYKNALNSFDMALVYNPQLGSVVSILKNEILEEIDINPSLVDLLFDFTNEANSLIKKAIISKNDGMLWDSLDFLEEAIKKDYRCKNSVYDLLRKFKLCIQNEFLCKKTNFEKTKFDKLKFLTYKSIIIENNPHKSLSLIGKIFEIDENDVDGLNYEGITYFNLGDYEKSIESFDESLRINGDYIFAYFNKGIVLRKCGFLNESLKCFEKVLENPNYYEKAKPYQEEILNKLNLVETP